MEPKVEIVTVFGQCKCCVQYGYLKHMWSEHEWRGEREIYGEMLKATFGVDWEIEIDSEYICEPCITRVREAFNFKKRMLSTDEIPVNEDSISTDMKVEKVEILEDFKQDREEQEDLEGPEDSGSVAEVHKLDSADEGTDQGEPVSADDYEDYVVNDDDGDEEMIDEDSQDFEEIEYLEEDAEFVEKSCKTKFNDSSASKINETSDSDTEKETKMWVKQRKNVLRRYRNYSMMDMKRGIHAVMSENMSIDDAAKMYQIPRKTLNVQIALLRKKKKDNGTQSKARSMTKKEELSKHQTNVSTVLACTNATPFKSHGSYGYACQFCPMQFQKPADLKLHTNSHKNISKNFKVGNVCSYVAKLDMTSLICTICKKNIDKLTIKGVYKHLIKHGKVIHLDVNNHIVPFKFNSVKFECALCDMKFDYYKLLSFHMNEHYSNYICAVCKKTFVNEIAWKAHSKRHDTGIYDCRYCDKQFETNARRVGHERVVHVRKNKVHKCMYCGETFKDKVQKAKHEVKEHGAEPKKFVCELCNKVCNSQRALTAHTKSIHLKLRPHKCNECEKAYFTTSSLRLHMVIHTNERNYECDICGLSLRRRTNLKQHLKCHEELQKNLL